MTASPKRALHGHAKMAPMSEESVIRPVNHHWLSKMAPEGFARKRLESAIYMNIGKTVSISINEVVDNWKKLTNHSPEIVSEDALKRTDEIYELVGDNIRLQKIAGAISHANWEASSRWMLERARP